MKTKELLGALSVVKPGLGNKEIEQSTAFAFKDDRVVTYNDEISISHPVTGLNLTGAIKAEELYQFLNKTNEEDVEIKENKDRTKLVIKAGKAKASFIMQSEITLDLTQLEGKKKWKPIPSDFLDAISFTVLGCSKDASAPALTCLHFTKGRVEATDRYRAVRHQISTDFELLLPGDTVSVIKEMKPDKICIEKQWVHFKNEYNTILSCRIFEAEFPDIDRFFNDDGEELKLPSKLSEIIERASIFAKRDYMYDEHLTIELADKMMTVKASCDSAEFDESTPIRYKGNPVVFTIVPYLLQDILKQKDCKVFLSNNKIMFVTDLWKYIAVLSIKK